MCIERDAEYPCPVVGFCLVLLIARKEETKQTLVHGVGLRFAIANWIQAAWAVAFVSIASAAWSNQLTPSQLRRCSSSLYLRFSF
jgi:hypothetical protein